MSHRGKSAKGGSKNPPKKEEESKTPTIVVPAKPARSALDRAVSQFRDIAGYAGCRVTRLLSGAEYVEVATSDDLGATLEWHDLRQAEVLLARLRASVRDRTRIMRLKSRLGVPPTTAAYKDLTEGQRKILDLSQKEFNSFYSQGVPADELGARFLPPRGLGVRPPKLGAPHPRKRMRRRNPPRRIPNLLNGKARGRPKLPHLDPSYGVAGPGTGPFRSPKVIDRAWKYIHAVWRASRFYGACPTVPDWFLELHPGVKARWFTVKSVNQHHKKRDNCLAVRMSYLIYSLDLQEGKRAKPFIVGEFDTGVITAIAKRFASCSHFALSTMPRPYRPRAGSRVPNHWDLPATSWDDLNYY